MTVLYLLESFVRYNVCKNLNILQTMTSTHGSWFLCWWLQFLNSLRSVIKAVFYLMMNVTLILTFLSRSFTFTSSISSTGDSLSFLSDSCHSIFLMQRSSIRSGKLHLYMNYKGDYLVVVYGGSPQDVVERS